MRGNFQSRRRRRPENLWSGASLSLSPPVALIRQWHLCLILLRQPFQLLSLALWPARGLLCVCSTGSGTERTGRSTVTAGSTTGAPMANLKARPKVKAAAEERPKPAKCPTTGGGGGAQALPSVVFDAESSSCDVQSSFCRHPLLYHPIYSFLVGSIPSCMSWPCSTSQLLAHKVARARRGRPR